MRPRDEVTEDLSKCVSQSERDAVQLEVLLDIRELLMAQADNTAICAHGHAGICMLCVRDYDLLRPRV